MSKRSCLIAAVIIFILVVILVICAGICIVSAEVFSSYDFESLSIAESETIVEGGSDKIVIIRIEGMIMDVEAGTDLWGSSFASSQQIIEYLDYALNDKEVKAVILSMDTPGGDVYASDIIYNKVKAVQAGGVKVVTLMRNTAASGGYYIAAPSDKIIVSPLTITGSIGVRADMQSLAGLYEKLGIETRTITNSGGDFKTGEGLFDDDPYGEEDEIYQGIIDECFDKFVTVVAEGRNMKKSDVLAIADGRIFTGRQAKQVGLVDEFGDLNDAIDTAEGLSGISDATVMEYKEDDFWSSLAGYVGNVINPVAGIMNTIDATPGIKLKYLQE